MANISTFSTPLSISCGGLWPALTADRPRHPSCKSTYLSQMALRIDGALLIAHGLWLAAESHVTCLWMKKALFSEL